MSTVREIWEYFEALVPNGMKLDFDNVGLLVGLGGVEVKRALIALDITDEVIDEAVQNGAQIILSHHPMFFELKRVGDDMAVGARIVKLVQNGISALCLHTNLDQIKGGVNDALAAKLGLKVEGFLGETQTAESGVEYGMGRYGSLSEPVAFEQFLSFVQNALGADGLRYYGAEEHPVFKLAVCGGTGGSYIEAAHARGCDTIVTADVKHHEFLTARALGVNVIDGGHFFTENVVVPVLADMLRSGFPDIEVSISERACSPSSFYVN